MNNFFPVLAGLILSPGSSLDLTVTFYLIARRKRGEDLAKGISLGGDIHLIFRGWCCTPVRGGVCLPRPPPCRLEHADQRNLRLLDKEQYSTMNLNTNGSRLILGSSRKGCSVASTAGQTWRI